MGLLPLKRLKHSERLSRLIPKPYESLEEIGIKIKRLKIEIKSVLCNTIWELAVTIQEISNKAKIDKCIIEKKKEIIDLLYRKIESEKLFSICDRILMYDEQVVIPGALKERVQKDFQTSHPGIVRIKDLMRSFAFYSILTMK